MKTILLLTTISALLLGSIYLYSQTTVETNEEVQAFEDKQILTNGVVYWDLRNLSLDDQLMNSIAKSISRGKIQENVGTQYIYGIDIDVSNNTSINSSSVGKLLQAINEGLPLLNSIVVKASNNNLKYDSAFEGYTIPYKVTTFKFVCQGNLENTVANISETIKKATQLKNLQIDVYRGYLKNAQDLVDALSSKTILTDLIFEIGSNYKELGTATFFTSLNTSFAKNKGIKNLTLGLSTTGITKQHLNAMEEVIYDSKSLSTFSIDVRNNSLKKTDVDEIFQDVSNKITTYTSYA